jgi:hypothetical protein
MQWITNIVNAFVKKVRKEPKHRGSIYPLR